MVSYFNVQDFDERSALQLQFQGNFKTVYRRTNENLSQVNKEDLILDQNNRRVSGFYSGRAFVVMDVLAKEHSFLAKITRVCFGSLLTLATLGLSLCFQGGRDLFSSRKIIVISMPLHNENKESTAMGIMTKQVKGIKLGDKTLEYWDGAPIYRAHIGITNNSDALEGDLDAVEIRDILDWLPSRQFTGNIQDFSKAEYLSFGEMAGQLLS